MDYFEKISAIVEHPEDYTSEEIEQALLNPEAGELYNIMCMTSAAMQNEPTVNIDDEWQRFVSNHPETETPTRGGILRIFGKRVAAFPLYLTTALGVAALGAGITIGITGDDNPAETIKEEITLSDTNSPENGGVSAVSTDPSPILFDNKELDEILSVIGERYNVGIEFRNEATKNLRMFYTLDPEKSIDEIVSELNTFEQIDIRRDGNLLIVNE